MKINKALLMEPLDDISSNTWSYKINGVTIYDAVDKVYDSILSLDCKTRQRRNPCQKH